MRIGIDASRALLAQRTGTENYSLQLIQHLLTLAEQEGKEHSFVLYCPEKPQQGLFPKDGWQERVIPFPRLWTHVRLSWEMLWDKPDVLFVPAHVIPLVHPKASVVTIHDLGHLYYPETYPKNTLRYMTWATEHNVKTARHIIADSEATKRDIVRHFSVSQDRINVVYPGVSPLFHTNHPPAALAAVRERYGIKGPYILYVGTLHPRKNLERLLEAFVKTKRERGLEEHLVIAGRLGWLPEGILQRLEEVGEAVTLAGYVPDSDLPLLYAGATLFVLPSLFEGFGMPVLEAMACGAPVLAADTSSLPEVVGDAGVFFDPHDVNQLAESLVWLCQHPDELDELRAKGLARAQEFTWEEAARRTLQTLESAVAV